VRLREEMAYMLEDMDIEVENTEEHVFVAYNSQTSVSGVLSFSIISSVTTKKEPV